MAAGPIGTSDGLRCELRSPTDAAAEVMLKARKVSFAGADAVLLSAFSAGTAEEVEPPPQAGSSTADTPADSQDPALRQIFEATPGQMAVLRPGSFEVLVGTAEFFRAIGREAAQAVGRPLFELFPENPEDPERRAARQLEASLRRVEVFKVTHMLPIRQFPVFLSDDRFVERYWSTINTPVLSPHGDVEFIIHRVEDITELMERTDAQGTTSDPADVHALNHVALLRIRELEAALTKIKVQGVRLEAAEALLGLGSWEFDPGTGQLFWAERVHALYGVPVEKGSPGFDEYVAMVHPDDRDAMLANYREFADENLEILEFEHRIVRPDGSIRRMHGIGRRHVVEGREQVLGFVQDVTQLFDTRAALREMRDLIQLAGEKVRLGGWRVHLDSGEITWTDEAFRIHERPYGPAPRLQEAIAYYTPAYRNVIAAAFNRCAQEGLAFDEVCQIVTDKGNRRWVRAVGTPVPCADGRIVAIQGALQDISDLREAEERAEEAQRQRLEVLESIADGFYTLDEEYRFTFLNAQAERVLQRRREDLLGKHVWREFPDLQGTQFEEEYRRAMSTGETQRFSFHYPPLDAWFGIDVHRVPGGLTVYFRDVTSERERTEQLRLLSSAIRRLNDMVLITEANLIDGPHGPKIVYASPSFYRDTGFTRDEVIGKTPRILQGPETSRAALDRIRTAMDTAVPMRVEIVNYRKDGTPFWLELEISPVSDEDENISHFVAIQRDITERKQAEKRLQLSEQRLRTVTREHIDAIADHDLIRNRQWWSLGLQEVFGHPVDPDEAHPGVWQRNIHPDDAERVTREFETALSTGADTIETEYSVRKADGTWVMVREESFVFHDADGAPVRIVSSVKDLTEELAHEEKKRQAQRLEAIGQLTGGVAHDFNNILTVILGNAEILSEQLPEGEQAHSMSEMIVTAAERGAELTARLLAFARRQNLEPQVVDLNQVIRNAEGLLRRALPEDIEIEVIRGAGLWQTEIDPGQLEVALLNLALNSRDVMPEGGRLTIETANAWLDEAYASENPEVTPGRYAMIAVSDTGTGMDAETIRRAFEPFFTTKEVGKGSGLGLSMVFGFVKQSGGHIKIYSEVGEGTTIRLYFPRVRAGQQSNRPSKGQSEKIEGGTEHVLVVEDNDLVRLNLCQQLRSLGYRVTDVDSAAAALDVLQEQSDIDLLFTDVVMPGGMNGRELSERARSLRPDLPVLFMSGYSENVIARDGRLYDGVNFIGKPFRLATLARKLRAVFNDRPRSANGQ